MRNCVFALLIFMPAALLSAESVELTVVYTAETHAALYPCDCPFEPDGGIARRATAIRRIRQGTNGRVLVLDSGNAVAGGLYDESSVSPKQRELAILITARGLDCQFIWDAHAGSGRRAGLSDALVNALRDRQPLPPSPADEIALINYGLDFFQTHRVSEATFQEAQGQFGTVTLVELTALMGYYSQLAFQAHAFDIDLPEQRSEPLLPT